MIDIRQPAQSTLPPERWMELMIWGHHSSGFVSETATVRHTQDTAREMIDYHSIVTDEEIEESFDETFGLEPFSNDPDYHAAKADRRARWGHD